MTVEELMLYFSERTVKVAARQHKLREEAKRDAQQQYDCELESLEWRSYQSLSSLDEALEETTDPSRVESLMEVIDSIEDRLQALRESNRKDLRDALQSIEGSRPKPS